MRAVLSLRVAVVAACALAHAAALSERLTHALTLAQRPWACGAAPRGLVADVCCDHGYLAAELASLGRRVVAVDIAETPLENAVRHFADRGVAAEAFLLGDGVAAVARDAALPWCETAIVAGVGARTAARLIDAACDAGAPPRRFVVQPTQQHIAHARDLRSTLWARGYDVAEELWLDDNGARLRRTGRRVLVTLRAERRGDGDDRRPPGEAALLVGAPTASAARRSYVEHHRDWLADIVRGLPEGADARARSERWLALLDAEARA